jgi:hypothetical protein
MVKAAGEESGDPAASFVLRLVELHREIDVTYLERATRVGAEDPDLTHATEVATVCLDDTLEEGVDPLRRFGPLHALRLVPEPAIIRPRRNDVPGAPARGEIKEADRCRCPFDLNDTSGANDRSRRDLDRTDCDRVSDPRAGMHVCERCMRVSDSEHVLVTERELELGLVAVEDPRRWMVKASVRCDHARVDVLLRQQAQYGSAQSGPRGSRGRVGRGWRRTLRRAGERRAGRNFRR